MYGAFTYIYSQNYPNVGTSSFWSSRKSIWDTYCNFEQFCVKLILVLKKSICRIVTHEKP